MRAAIYARYSTDKQSQSSIEDQIRVCSEYALRRGWKVLQTFTDEGISGAAFGNRPGVRQLERMSLEGGCDVVVVMDLTRLSRSMSDLSRFLDRLKFKRVTVVGVQDGFDSTSRTARMQAGMSGIMSEEFRAMVADRTRSALTMRAELGQSTGGRAYGYVPEEAPVLLEIFCRFASGETMKAIASDLNRREVPSPGARWQRKTRAKHGRWLVSALHEMLTNERYMGRLVYNKSQWIKDPDSGKRRRVERPQAEWVVRQIAPLIDETTWCAARSRFKPGRGRGGVPSYLLSGLLVCKLCRSKMVVYGGSQRRYVCSAYHGGGVHACSNTTTIPRLIAEQHILKPVIDDLLSPAAIAAGMARMREAARDTRPRDDTQVKELERLVREGILQAEVAAPALAEAKRRAQPAAAIPLPSERLWRETVQTMRDVLQGDDVAAARETLRELIGEILISPTEGGVIAELTAHSEMLGTGSGIWVGSGGANVIHIRCTARAMS